MPRLVEPGPDLVHHLLARSCGVCPAQMPVPECTAEPNEARQWRKEWSSQDRPVPVMEPNPLYLSSRSLINGNFSSRMYRNE